MDVDRPLPTPVTPEAKPFWDGCRTEKLMLPRCEECGHVFFYPRILCPRCHSRRIGWMAHDHNIQMVSHGWNTAIGVAADLQLAAAMPVARYVEYLTPCAYIEALTVERFVIGGEGFLEIPQRPGLGVTFKLAAAKARLAEEDRGFFD